MLGSMPSLWDSFAGLTLRIDDVSVQRRELAVSSEFTRVTTTVLLHGNGVSGEGEDVTYTAEDHSWFPADVALAGTWTLAEYSSRLDDAALWRDEPRMEASRDYRRWAFESAALDLAFRQAGTSLAAVVGRPYRPVRFVASTRAKIDPYLELNPELEFKLDVDKDWDRALMERLAATDRVRVLDLKAYYRGTVVDLEPDPELYRAVVACFPEAVIEDPWLEGAARDALRGAEERLSFDAPIHSWDDVGRLAVEPRWLNVKPSRFGTLRRVLECIERCEAAGIRMYGGGQFELGPGRRQIQRLAGVFYADGPNDVAPSAYNEGPPRPGLPTSPLPAPEGVGF
jgi:L-alanine-DL-glutamate epimerase-like enolase superfamily enzyme